MEDIYENVLNIFRHEMPDVAPELHYSNTFELLIAVVLSAQCTDKRVNMVTPELFADYPTAAKMAEADINEIYEYIKSVSYPNAKAKYLVELSQMIMNDFNGEVPDNRDDLMKLPGVGRKTANVVEAVAFSGIAMPVDTHVFRVSHRLGLVGKECTTPYKVEKELIKHIPQNELSKAHHWLLLHGRYVCKSIKPRCNECFLNELCPSRKY